MPTNLENSAVATGLEKAVVIPISKAMPKNVQTIALISHVSKVNDQNSPSQASAIREP